MRLFVATFEIDLVIIKLISFWLMFIRYLSLLRALKGIIYNISTYMIVRICRFKDIIMYVDMLVEV